MMKLTTNNIKFVKELTKDGIAYSWFVAMKSNYVSDSRNYVNYVNGKTTADVEYPAESLPKAVKAFIEKRERKQFYENEHDGAKFEQFIYR